MAQNKRIAKEKLIFLLKNSGYRNKLVVLSNSSYIKELLTRSGSEYANVLNILGV